MKLEDNQLCLHLKMSQKNSEAQERRAHKRFMSSTKATQGKIFLMIIRLVVVKNPLSRKKSFGFNFISPNSRLTKRPHTLLDRYS